jgi:hypothetical protein
MSIVVKAVGYDRQGLQRLFDSLWYDILCDEPVGREAGRCAGIDVPVLRDRVAGLVPDAVLREIPSPICVSQAGGESAGAAITFTVRLHAFWPCAASGAPEPDLAEVLESLLHCFLVPEVSAMLQDRVINGQMIQVNGGAQT